MKKISYVMTKQVISCHPESNLAEAGALLWQHNCGALPVADNEGRVIGMITDRDICIALTTRNRLASEITVGEVMSQHIHYCFEESGIDEVLKIMRDAKVRRVPVADQDLKVRGIISLSDILIRTEEGYAAAAVLKSIIVNNQKTVAAAAN